ncbi:hypothetical protein [Amycolatopsis sp. NPDC049868]|uniref:hypothetical protein n=1 Tax=Amycolatopsis sp. NPDC049868 TaxID=3363934 RepID=UPI0037898D57
MDTKVLQGALVEVPTGTVTGVDRRAFGEFVGPQGELASYAFGWTTGSDPHVARLSVGIGAGNPGGGTFHAVVFEHEDGHAFSLTDDPFERVPEGGPDLTADEARAHEDLPFIWWVADQVMQRDRRAWWMRHWLLRTTCIQTREIFERSEPILLVQHDADDGMWQLIGASDADSATGKIGHLHHAIDEDQTLIDTLDLPAGGSATRTGIGRPWNRHC